MSLKDDLEEMLRLEALKLRDPPRPSSSGLLQPSRHEFKTAWDGEDGRDAMERMRRTFAEQNRAYTLPPYDGAPAKASPLDPPSGTEMTDNMADLEHLQTCVLELSSHLQDVAAKASTIPSTGAAGTVRADIADLLSTVERLKGHLDAYVAGMFRISNGP